MSFLYLIKFHTIQRQSPVIQLFCSNILRTAIVYEYSQEDRYLYINDIIMEFDVKRDNNFHYKIIFDFCR